MKTLLKKGTYQIDKGKKEECLKNWGTIAYGKPLDAESQNKAVNMNDIFRSRETKVLN
jgi:hypothetical protein